MVFVAVLVIVLVGELVGLVVGVLVGLRVGVLVGVRVGELVGVAVATTPLTVMGAFKETSTPRLGEYIVAVLGITVPPAAVT
jgi:hypothetical protein